MASGAIDRNASKRPVCAKQLPRKLFTAYHFNNIDHNKLFISTNSSCQETIISAFQLPESIEPGKPLDLKVSIQEN